MDDRELRIYALIAVLVIGVIVSYLLHSRETAARMRGKRTPKW